MGFVSEGLGASAFWDTFKWFLGQGLEDKLFNYLDGKYGQYVKLTKGAPAPWSSQWG